MSGKQEKKQSGTQASSASHKAGIVKTHARLGPKKLRRVYKASGLPAAVEYAEDNDLESELNRLETSGLVARREKARARRAGQRGGGKMGRRGKRDPGRE